MKRKRREILPVSFNYSEWDRGLYEYATDARHGGFGPFVKRLIAAHRDGQRMVNVVTAPVIAEEIREDDVEAAEGFL